jgi:glycosyltransferase involved in cell wall biosynthesis
MKILLASTGIQQHAGTYTVIKNLAPLLAKNHDVTLLTNEGNVDIKDVKLVQLKSSNFPFPQYFNLPELKKIVTGGFLDQFDIIHCYEYPIFLTDFLTKIKKSYKAPLVISAHGSIHQFTGFPNNLLKKIHNNLMKKYVDNVSMFIASTNAEKNHLIEHNIPSEKIEVLSLGVNIQQITRNPSSELSIIYVGRLTVTKNVDLLIESIPYCERKDFQVIVAGPDFGTLSKLQNIVKKLGLEDRVIFKGEISESEKNRLFSSSTLFVHPSLEDVFSLSLIEAAGAGVPSIAFDVEANSEILSNECGRIVEEYSPLSLSKMIDSLLNDSNEREKISNIAKNLIPKKYDWNITVRTLENLYSSLL